MSVIKPTIVKLFDSVGLSIYLFLFSITAYASPAPQHDSFQLTEQDKLFLKQFSLASLPPAPESIGNVVADNIQAAEFGQKLFFDTRLSQNKNISCASCHNPSLYFSDNKAFSVGSKLTERNSPSLLPSPYSPWLFWDGRKDSLWSQALAPIEDPNEHGISRIEALEKIVTHYHDDYRNIFGESALSQLTLALRDTATNQFEITEAFSRIGKLLEAYQRQLVLQPAKFDLFIDSLINQNLTNKSEFTDDEFQGLLIFLGKGSCSSCHNGPLFTNFEFHNTGAPEPMKNKIDLGRYTGIELLRQDEFSCISEWSDAPPDSCEEIIYLKKQGPELVGAFKTPSLRNVEHTAPYGHAGQFATLNDVISAYNKPTPPFYDPSQHPSRPHFDIFPLGLTDREQQQLIQFLNTLSSPIPKTDRWWKNPFGAPSNASN